LGAGIEATGAGLGRGVGGELGAGVEATGAGVEATGATGAGVTATGAGVAGVGGGPLDVSTVQPANQNTVSTSFHSIIKHV
jgi:hypothetical protein